MKRIIISIAAVLLLVFYGCGDYLDMVPEKDVETIESIFEIRASAENFYNSCVNAAREHLKFGEPMGSPDLYCGGEFVVGNFLRQSSLQYYYMGGVMGIPDGYQNTSTPYCNVWSMENNGVAVGSGYAQAGSVYACIRYCNIFIDNIERVNDMTMYEKKAWKAEVMCFKALYYFELMKRYGPIVLVPENIQTNEDIVAMQTPRSHVDVCFAEIIRLFDEAIPDLRPRNQMPMAFKARFSLEAAYAYKARVLLYAASPLFNGNEWYASFKNRDGEPLFDATYDPEKWRIAAEAADQAVQVAEQNGLKLVNRSQNKKTAKLRQIANLQASVINNTFEEEEWLFVQLRNGYWANIQLPKFNSKHQNSYYGGYGSSNPNIATVEMFYTENGLPIDKDKTWPYANRYKMGHETNTEYDGIVDLKKEVLNLHLRREPRFYANIAADGTFWEFSNTPWPVEPYKGASLGTELPRFNDPSAPQNITGYWSKKYFDSSTSLYSIPGTPFVLMRMADLYLMQAEAWNEYEGPSDKVYDAIDKVRTRAGILPIRTAWNQYSSSPGEIQNKAGLREAIHRERMIEFVFEGHHFWDLRRWKKAHLGLNSPHLGWNVMGQDAKTFYNNFDGPKIVWDKVQFVSPRDYFWPIKSEEIMISNIVQNPGW